MPRSRRSRRRSARRLPVSRKTAALLRRENGRPHPANLAAYARWLAADPGADPKAPPAAAD